MKKFVSLLLLVAIAFQLFPGTVFAISQSSVGKYVAFDDMATNYVPSDEVAMLSTDAVYVTETVPGGNKALKIVLKSTSNTVAFNSDVYENTATYSFDLRSDPGISGTVSLVSNGGSVTNVLTISEGGIISLKSGPELRCKLSADRFLNLKLIVNAKTKRISVYSGSSVLISNNFFESMPMSFAGVSISLTESKDIKSLFYIDNFVSASGEKPGIKVGSVIYNTKILDPVSEPDAVSAEKVIGDTVFVNSDFDSEISMAGIQISPGKHKIELVYDDKRNNGYLCIEPALDSSRIDVPMTATRYLVFEADLCAESLGFAGQLFMLGGSSTYSYILSLTKTGEVQTYVGKNTLCTLQKGKWTTISVICDLEEMTFDAYIDGKLVANDVSIKYTVKNNVSRLRALSMSSSGGCLYLDNLKAYEGIELRDISNIVREPKNIMPEGDEATSILANTVSFSCKSGALYNGVTKDKLAQKTVYKDGQIYISADDVSNLFGYEAECDYEKGIINIGSNVRLHIGSTDASINGKTLKTEHPPQLIDGIAYLPLEFVSETVFGKWVYIDDREFAIISSAPINYSDNELWRIHNYLLYERPEPDELLAMFNEKSAGVHPKIIINSKDIEDIKYNYQTKPYYKKWLDDRLAEADRIINYKCYAYEEEALLANSYSRKTIRDRVMTLAIAYFITGDTKYPQKAFLELRAASELPTWHHNEHALNTAETMIAFAIAYDWLYDCWTDSQKELIEKTVYEKGMQFAHDCYYGMGTGTSTWWATNDTNWGAAANSCTGVAAMAFMEVYPEFCSDLLSKALRGFEFPLQNFYPSGCWFEGTGYFDYVMDHVAKFSRSVHRTFGTDFNLLKAPSLELAGDYIISLDGPVASNNFHDNSEHHTLPGTVAFLAKTFNKYGYLSERLNAIDFYGLAPGLHDIIYWPTDYDPGVSATLQKDNYFSGTELVVMRSEYANPESTYISFHGGDVEVQHSHVDAGAFVLDMNGVRWAHDLGADDYNLDGYFETSKKRYTYYRVRAEGHNVPVIDPDESAGQELKAFAPVECLVEGESGSYSILDLTPAYKKQCTSLKRGFMMAENRRTVTIRDEYEFTEGEHELYWFMHTRASIEIVDDKTAILSHQGKQLKAQLVSNIEGAKFTVMEAKPLETSPNPTQTANKNTSKLTVNAKASGNAYVQVRFSNVSDELSKLEAKDIPLSQWTADNTPYSSLPVIADISADGATIAGFDPKVTGYLLPVSYRTRKMPVITYSANDDCDVEITYAQSPLENTEIKVIRRDNPLDARTYVIRYQLQITSEDKEYIPVSIKASRNPQAANCDFMACDGDLSTRWSADGDGEWLQLEFAESVPVKLVRVAAMNATVRKTRFDIEVSEDGINWTKIASHETDGVTDGYEYIECDTKARFIRLVGHGNSVNEWNSICEFGIIDTRGW